MSKKRGVASSGQAVVMKRKGCRDFLSALAGQGTKCQVEYEWYNGKHSEFTHLLLLDILRCSVFWTINLQEALKHMTVCFGAQPALRFPLMFHIHFLYLKLFEAVMLIRESHFPPSSCRRQHNQDLCEYNFKSTFFFAKLGILHENL